MRRHSVKINKVQQFVTGGWGFFFLSELYFRLGNRVYSNQQSQLFAMLTHLRTSYGLLFSIPEKITVQALLLF